MYQPLPMLLAMCAITTLITCAFLVAAEGHHHHPVGGEPQ